MFDKTYRSPSEALHLIISGLATTSPETETLELEDCCGRVLASDFLSPEDLPAFSRSTVDGFALRAADTFGARETAPVYIAVRGEVFMGAAPGFILGPGEAARMPTGGMLPDGADAVVMVEHTQAVSDDMIEVLHAVAPFENVIQRGDDVRRGERVLMKGRRLRPQDIGALAGLGMTRVGVFRKPVVSIIATGDEIVPAGSTPGPGQVRDINSYTLAGLIAEHGGTPVRKGIVSDRSGDISAVIGQSIRDSDIVLVGGGTSAGTKDMTARIINEAGTPGVLFHGASLKPGKPVIGGIVSGKPVFGLPGHPAAIFVCFDLFIRPLLDRLGGIEERLPVSAHVTAAMAKGVASAAGREDHVRVALEERDGVVVAVPVLGKSGLITTLVKADGIVVVPPAKLGVDEGETVQVRLF